MALSRFESDNFNKVANIRGVSAKFCDENPELAPLMKRLAMDPDLDQEGALALVQLPAETMYLIDKVVRLKAKQGPIGIDNSEVINLEFENDFKAKNKHIFRLNDANTIDEEEEIRKASQGYVDENGVFHSANEDARLFAENEKLLQRLTHAVYKENGKPDV
jgi:hypothetical protein